MDFEAMDFNHHSFTLPPKPPAKGPCLCEVCGGLWNDEKHLDWKGNRIPMKNVSVIIVKEDGTSERRASEDEE